MFNIKQNLAKKLDPILKSSNLKEMTYHSHFYAQNSKCPRRCWEIDAEILHTCFTCPSRGLTPVFFFFFFFFIANIWAKGGPLFQKILTDKKTGAKKQNKNQQQVRSSQGHIENVFKNFTAWIKKTAWTFAGEQICFFQREAVCSFFSCI